MLGTDMKRPDDRLDYDVDFARRGWLDESDTIIDASAHAEPADISVDTVAVYGPVVKVWLSGGEAGRSYKINVIVSTAEGRVKEDTFQIRVVDC